MCYSCEATVDADVVTGETMQDNELVEASNDLDLGCDFDPKRF